MKTKFNFYLVCCLMAVSFVAFSSCDQNGDTTKPVINLLEPEDGDTLRIGEEPEGIHLDMELSDDVMLKSYKVEIHSNFDGHAHEVPSKSEASETVDFTFNKSWDVSGLKNTDVHHHEIIVPVNATPGKYHMMIYCTDAAGNEAHVARNIVLSTEGGEEHEHEQEEEHEHEQEH